MVCTANDLQEWKDFPKGLRVLLLDEDIDSASEITSKLEAMDYAVSIFHNETEAVSAFSSKPETFHLAIVEVNTNNEDGTFKFLETAKELPIVMTSNTNCLSTMMKCIALGAVEFLHKPLSEDKLKNIWQHVVHKAFNAVPGKEEEARVGLNLKLEKEEEPDKKISTETVSLSEALEIEIEIEQYPAPSTPQLKQGSRLLDDEYCCNDQTNCSTEKESLGGEQDGEESKSVETTTFGDQVAELALPLMEEPEIPSAALVKDERRSSESPKKTNGGAADNPSKVSGVPSHSGSKSNRKKMKVDWTPELHKKFVHAVEQLGVDQAIPSRILEIMKVEGLTRHNVASHLQKYRMHKRHILPREEERRWPRPRDPMQRNCYPQHHQQPPPVMAFPTYHSNHAVPAYPVWGQPGQGGQMWGPPAYPPPWQPPPESWQYWNPYPGVHADTWGCPVMPQPAPHPPCASSYPQNASGFHHVIDNAYNTTTTENSFDTEPAEEVIDKVVKEAINKPWLPLPLGLKPPSTDSVLSELSRQGISAIPPHHD